MVERIKANYLKMDDLNTKINKHFKTINAMNIEVNHKLRLTIHMFIKNNYSSSIGSVFINHLHVGTGYFLDSTLYPRDIFYLMTRNNTSLIMILTCSTNIQP